MKLRIKGRWVGLDHPTYIVAEMSANHNKKFETAVKIIKAAKESGADAIKLQTYTPDTITINCNNDFFTINDTIWKGKTLYQLYDEAYTPWDWQPKLKEVADDLGLDFFSTPFDASAVDFLESIGILAYKIASFEIVDLPLIQKIAKTGKPIIMSTGMATLSEIEEAVQTIFQEGCNELALLKCTSSYPAQYEQMNLRAIPHLSRTFGVPTGLSDHTLGSAVPIAAVALGACIIEKHFTISRAIPGPDSAFSMEPHEFKQMVDAVRSVENALGTINYKISKDEEASRIFRRSLFVVKDIKAGEKFTSENVRSIRPGFGLHTRYYEEILTKKASSDIKKGTPLSLNLIQGRLNDRHHRL